jgi:hypothetical protein
VRIWLRDSCGRAALRGAVSAAWWHGWVLCCGCCVLVAVGSRGGSPQVRRRGAGCGPDLGGAEELLVVVEEEVLLGVQFHLLEGRPGGHGCRACWTLARPTIRGAGASGENLASVSVGAGSGNTRGVAIPCWRRCCEAPAYPTMRSWVLRVKTQAPDPPERATATSPRRFLLGGVALDTRSLVAVEARTLLWFLLLWGRWTPGQRPWTVVVRRGGGLGIRCGQKLHGVEQLLASLG